MLDMAPKLAAQMGDLAESTRIAWVTRITGGQLAMAEAIGRKIDAQRAELAQPSDGPLERLLIDRVALGQRVRRGEPLAAVALPHNGARYEVTAPHDGTVIGLATSPLVNPGDAVCHLAW